MAHSLGQGVSEKLRRAHLHRRDFERRVQGFVHSRAYTLVRHDDLEAGKRIWKAKVHKEPPLIAWGGLIGECLFNFRSALDHLAYDLAVANKGFPLASEVERRSEFPIFIDRAPEASELDAKIGAVDPQARNLIQQMQPYGRKDRAALKYLHLLHNFDKHRTLHLVLGVPTGVSHFGDAPFDSVSFQPFKDGDVIAEGPIPSDPKVNNDPSFTFGVAFSEDGPGSGYEVKLMLSWIGQHIEKGVLKPLLPFL